MRTVLLLNMAAPVERERRVTDEQRRERNRRKVRAFRARNRERWNEIQREWRKRRKHRLEELRA